MKMREKRSSTCCGAWACARRRATSSRARPGFAADDACSRRACAALAASMRPAAVAAPPVAAEAATPAEAARAPAAPAEAARARARGPAGPPAPRAPRGPARPPPESSSSDDDDGPAPAAPGEAARAPRRPTKRVKVEEDKHGGWTRAADGTKGDCDGKREGWMLTPPTAGELTALTKDGLPAAKSRLGSGRGALPQPTAAEVAADEERRRAARAARGPALVETFQAKKSTAPAQKPAKWTRDAMDAPQRMDAKAARAVIEKAKGLDSRFSSSYRQ